MHVWEVRAHTDCGIPVEVRGQLEVGGHFFFSTMWVLGIKCRLPGLVEDVFTN